MVTEGSLVVTDTAGGQMDSLNEKATPFSMIFSSSTQLKAIFLDRCPCDPLTRTHAPVSKEQTLYSQWHQGQNLAKFSNVIYSMFSGLPHILSK